ncbi:hypothetical protein G7046_g7314 [Stylonectria norvegica]|nr:hypothetical protein G7046_g7314 [Stylonectria norvegica]
MNLFVHFHPFPYHLLFHPQSSLQLPDLLANPTPPRQSHTMPPTQGEYDEPPLTREEKTYMNTNMNGEYHMLASHLLSIYKEEDRHEGRAIVRAYVAMEANEADDTANNASKASK